MNQSFTESTLFGVFLFGETYGSNCIILSSSDGPSNKSSKFSSKFKNIFSLSLSWNFSRYWFWLSSYGKDNISSKCVLWFIFLREIQQKKWYDSPSQLFFRNNTKNWICVIFQCIEFITKKIHSFFMIIMIFKIRCVYYINVLMK